MRPPVAQQEPETQWLYRVDFLPTAKDTFSFRYLHDRANFNPDLALNTSGLPGFDGEVGGPAEVGQGNWTHVFSARLLNEFRASKTRVNFLFQPTPETLANPLSKNYNITFSGQGFGGSTTPLGILQNIPQGSVPSTWLHFERGMFVFRVEAQNFTNHNNIGLLDINLLDIGTSSYLNKQNASNQRFVICCSGRSSGSKWRARSTPGRAGNNTSGPLNSLIAEFVTNGQILSASGIEGEPEGCFLGQMPGFGGTISITIA